MISLDRCVGRGLLALGNCSIERFNSLESSESGKLHEDELCSIAESCLFILGAVVFVVFIYRGVVFLLLLLGVNSLGLVLGFRATVCTTGFTRIFRAGDSGILGFGNILIFLSASNYCRNSLMKLLASST